jgi:hypothetical protein
MSAPSFAFVLGVAYTAAGILGMFSSLVLPPPANAPALDVTSQYGMMFGLFAVNSLANGLHLVIGLWGLLAWTGAASAVTYARTVAIITALLAVMGLLPGPNIAFGLLPLYGYNVVVHGATAILAAYIGFRSKARRAVASKERRHNGPNRRIAARNVADERRRGAPDRRSATFA